MGIRVNAFKYIYSCFYFLFIVFHLVPSPSPGGFPDVTAGKTSAGNVGDLGSIPEIRSPGVWNGSPLQ